MVSLPKKTKITTISSDTVYSKYTSQTAEAIEANFTTSRSKGLSSQEAVKRLQEFGLNKLSGKKLSALTIFKRQFASPFIYMLLVAAGLAYILGEHMDGSMILLFVLINSVLGFFQEYRSEQALKLLQQYTATHNLVRRDGKDIFIEAKNVVPGDILLVKPGDIVDADSRLLESNSLLVDESILTGESDMVSKTAQPLTKVSTEIFKADNILFSGTSVVSGTGLAVVVATGKKTVVGSIAKLSSETVRTSGFEKGMNKFSGFVLRLVLVTLVMVFLANILIKGDQANFVELVIFSIALAAAVIPEALPLVSTFSLSRGALRLAKHKVVVKRLSAIEDLGGIQVLCTDKTGTITQNKLKVVDFFTRNKAQLLWYAKKAMPAKNHCNGQDPFDTAIEKASQQHPFHQEGAIKHLGELPFDPDRRRGSVIISIDGQDKLIVRGAAESILPFCDNVDLQERKKLDDWIDEQGKLGRRVLAIAYKNQHFIPNYEAKVEEKKLSFLGCIAFVDPLKKTTKEAVAKARSLGLMVKIITGDSSAVAGAVATEIGLIADPKQVMLGEDLLQLTPRKQKEAVESYSVFARVSPQTKHHIIELLEQQFEVGYLGEGINDAPALKAANVALVVQGASDIAREAADIILLKSSLKVIVDGIEEGREVFANTLKYIKITLSSNFGNFFAVAISSLVIPFLPMLPIQILLVNLLSDFPLIAVATDSVDPAEVKKPESYNLKEFALIATTMGLVSTVFDFIFFGMFFKYSPSVLQTNWYIGSILTELILMYSLRTRSVFFKAKLPSLTIIILSILAIGTTIALPFTHFGQSIFQFTPPTPYFLTIIIGLVLLYFLSTEIVKRFFYKLVQS
ncbi:HAD-IC family P-type ATPase [Candidatus Beckwithbacteria bacterium]|nr:HAD-IC family P-type ATPase [Candidatus Beckwithbacteria bacterium]